MPVCKKKLVDERLIGPIRGTKKQPSNLNRMAQQDLKGIDGDPLYESVPDLKVPKFGEELVTSPYASGIRVGRDRLNDAYVIRKKVKKGESAKVPLSYGDGYAGKGTTACSMVDIYAGLDSWSTSKGVIPELPVNPNAFKDAARVYVSAFSDCDRLFNLPAGTIGKIEGRSTVVAKADEVRIHGRTGVKIVSGIDTKNSLGCDVGSSIPHINLMAGNVTRDDMEPIPKGLKLKAALDKVVAQINQLAGIVDKFLQWQTDFNTIIMGHTHPDAVAIGLGVCAGAGPKGLANGSVLQCPDLVIGGQKAGVFASLTKKDLLFHTAASKGVKISLMEDFSSDQINSKHVFTS